jgi:peptide/nickel transport system permease protein
MTEAGERPPALAAPDTWRERHTAGLRQIRLYAHTYARSFSALLGLVLVLGFLLLAVIGPWIVPYPGDATGEVHMDRKLLAPGAEHWFGTDEVGNDLLTRVVVGTRLSLTIALVITGVASVIGVPLGMVAGLKGGWLREVIMRTTDVFLSVPGLVLAIAIVAAMGPGVINSVIALSLVWWPGYVRLIESKTLALKNELYIEAARISGASTARIVFVHLLPNCLSPILVKASMDMGMAILAAASLGFIGLGAQPPAPEWGALISIGRNYLPTWWWYVTFPGLAIYLAVLGFNLMGDGLRDVFDPRSRGR